MPKGILYHVSALLRNSQKSAHGVALDVRID